MNRLMLLAFCLSSSMAYAQVRIPDGNVVIRAPVGESEMVITTTSRLAGAIHSLTWNGKEFIDSFDHGRQLQSASNFDAGTPIKGETFNPTEAGSRDDGAGPQSTSRLLHMVATSNSSSDNITDGVLACPGSRFSRQSREKQNAFVQSSTDKASNDWRPRSA